MKPVKQKKILGFLASLSLFTVMLSFVLCVSQSAFAQAPQDDLNAALNAIQNTTKLPGYDKMGHAQSSYEPGAGSITSAILYTADLLKYLLGTIAIVIIIFAGVKLVTTGKKIDETATKTKEMLKYAIIGLIVVMVSDTMVKQVFFGEAGEVVKSTADAQLAAERGSELVQGLYNFAEVFLGAVAVFMIVLSGARMAGGFGKSEEQITKGRKQITWAVAGLVLVGLSEFIVKDIVFPKQGTEISNIAGAANLIVTITNFISSFIATITIAMIMYGGYIYVTAMGDPAKSQKGKKIITAAVIGLFIALGAYAIVNSVATFKTPPGVMAPTANQLQTK